MAINATRLYHEYMAEHRLSEEDCAAACSVAQMVNTADESRATQSGRRARVAANTIAHDPMPSMWAGSSRAAGPLLASGGHGVARG